MTSKDQLKVMRCGFKIIRSDQHNLLIKFIDKDTLNWNTLEKGFASKAALKRKMDKLLEMNFIIED